MENHPANKNTCIHYTFIFVFSLSCMLLFTGCSNMAEVQDRDFGLALGVSLTEEQFQLTYALPDLSALTNESKTDKNENNNGHTRTYTGTTFTEIEDQYNHGSNKLLDYRHLEALILDETISSSADKLPVLLEYLSNKYEISHDVRIFYYPGDVKKLIEEKGKISGNIGDYLKKLENNNQRKNGLPSVTIGNLLDSYYQKKGLVVPLLESTEDKLAVNGAAVFQNSVFVKQLTDEQLSIYYVIKGLGKEFNFYQNDLVFKLKEIDSKSRYFYRDNKPVIQLTIKGTAELISLPSDHPDADTEINNYLTDAVLNQINTGFKSDKADYINLYDESSIKNRDIWLSYQNRRTDFINDVVIELNMDIQIQ